MGYLIFAITAIGAITMVLSKVFKKREHFRMFLVYLLIAYVVIIGLALLIKLLS